MKIYMVQNIYMYVLSSQGFKEFIKKLTQKKKKTKQK